MQEFTPETDNGYRIEIHKIGGKYHVSAHGVYYPEIHAFVSRRYNGLLGARSYASKLAGKLGFWLHDFTEKASGKRNPDGAVIT